MSALLEAIVVGAGPAGSAAATVLASCGHRVLLIDRAAFPRDKPCGDYCNPGAVRMLSELGCRDDVVAAGAVPISSMSVFAQDGTGFEAPFPSGQGLLVPRLRLDACLVAHAVRSGAEILEGTRITGIRLGDGYVEAHADHARIRSVRARLLIAADGMHSTIAHRLGVLPGGPRGRYTVGAYFSGLRGIVPRGELHLGPNLYGGVAHFGEGTANVCLALPRYAFYHRHPEQAFHAGLQRLPHLTDILAGARRESAYRCSGPVGFVAHKVVTDRVLFAGDAAGQVEPMTGQGISFALQSGYLAAKAAAHALVRGDLSREALQPYARERARQFAGRLKVARWIQHLVFRTPLTPHLVKRLATHPGLARQLLGVTGDVVAADPFRVLGFMLRLSVGADAHDP